MTEPDRSGRMVARLPLPGPAISPPGAGASVQPPQGRAFSIVISAADGAPLLRMFEREGRLAIEGDESRWEEAAARFLLGMMQWSGTVGIAWKDEVMRAAGGQ